MQLLSAEQILAPKIRAAFGANHLSNPPNDSQIAVKKWKPCFQNILAKKCFFVTKHLCLDN
jgi:hypothetical protein